MAKLSKREKDKIELVMHEFKEGTLMSRKDGKGGKVETRQQAIAIALSEAAEVKEDEVPPKKEDEIEK